MYLFFGLFLVAALVLSSLYFFVFKKTNYLINLIVLVLASFLPLLMPSMHTIFYALILFPIGLFIIYAIKKDKDKSNL
jgi:hypothetical protein